MKSWGDIMHKDTYFDSCGKGKIHVCRWEPEGKPRAIVQLVHGIAEYAQRYAPFAEFLTAQGFLVVAEDHVGHGKSITHLSEKGCIKDGWFAMVKDTYRLLQHTKQNSRICPMFFLDIQWARLWCVRFWRSTRTAESLLV